MKKDPKIIIGILANDHEVIPHRDFKYARMVQASRETCYSKEAENVERYFIYGRRQGVNFNGQKYGAVKDEFYYDWPEERRFILNKTMAFFHFCYHRKEFDYIFRTNCGSYVNVDLLKQHIEKIQQTENVYMAIKNVQFAPNYGSGAGIIFSRDVIGKLLDKHALLQNGIDDVEFGKVLYEHYGIEVTPGALRKDVRYDDIIKENPVDAECYHYYFRATKDPRCFHEIHKRTLELNK